MRCLVIASTLTVWIAFCPSSARAAQPAAAVALDQSELHFAILLRDGRAPVVTPPQIVLIDPIGSTERVVFSADTNHPWLAVGSPKGEAPGRLSIGIVPSAVTGPPRKEIGEVTVRTGTDSSAPARTLHVSLTILGPGSEPAFGSLDAPAGEVELSSAGTMFAGWALDDVAVTDVEICRDRSPQVDSAASNDECGDNSKTLLGRATFAYGGRPDIMKIFAVPRNGRASWSYVLQPEAVAGIGPSPFQLYAIAQDAEGHAHVLGKRTVNLGASNAATIPFLMISVGFMVVCFASGQLWLRGRLYRVSNIAADTITPRVWTMHWAEWAALTLVIAVFVALQLSTIRKGLQYDELYTASHFVVGHSLWDAASTVAVFNNHIAYSLLAGVSVRLFGPAEWALRLPAATLGVFTLIAVWAFARQVSNRHIAVTSAAFLAISPLFFTWSHMARGYAGLTLMSVASALGFFALLRQPSRVTACGHAIASVLAVYFNLYGIWIVAVQYLIFVWLMLRPARPPVIELEGGDQVKSAGLRLLWVSFSVTGIALVLLYLPVMQELTAVVQFRGRTPLRAAFPRELYDAFTASSSPVLSLGAVAIAALGLFRQRRIEAAYLVLSLGVPLTAMWLIVRPLDLYPRFFVFWAPLFAYLLASGLFTLAEWVFPPRSRSVRLAAVVPLAGAMIACGFLITDWLGQDRKPAPDGYGEVGRIAKHEAGWQSFAIGGDAEMFDYYLPKPFALLRSNEELDRIMHESPHFQVVYHDMTWNSAADRGMAEALKTRCEAQVRAPVVMFHCN